MALEHQPAAAPAAEFRPYVANDARVPELTARAVIVGMFFGLVFGAVTVYVGLRAGLTVSASIPIAVLSIGLLRRFGSTILENNIVQTTGSAGESVAAGVIFTLPALIFLGFDLEYSRILFLAMIGGWLGVLFMIPLRRQLIVKEHANLLYPEGTACADVLVAGEKGGSFASRVFYGLGLGGVYTLFQNEHAFAVVKSTPTYDPLFLPGASLRANITSEYLGVGYIIGPRIAGTIFAGGVFSWLVMMPAIKFFGSLVPTPIYPSTVPIALMTSDQLWNFYIRYIGAGAVAAAGLITLAKTLPTIVAALRAGATELRKSDTGGGPNVGERIDRDLPLTLVLAGSAVIVLMLWSLLTLKPVPSAPTGAFDNAMASVLVVVFGFLFVTVSSRICGLIGTSANPVSGMTIATLMATCALFLAAGWTGPAYAALALTVGGVVCIAAANAGATSQDLKTGFLVGATPSSQQIALFAGVTASAFVIGGTLMLMNKALERYQPAAVVVDVNALPEGVVVQGEKEYQGRSYTVLNAIGSSTVAEGKYLLDPQTGQVELQWIQGIGSQDAPAPQARLMSVVINGILTQKLPWGLVLLGVFLVIAVELLGIRSLSFAVGSYLSIGTTAAIFCGGIVRWLAERGMKKTEEGEASPGALYASGLIAAGGIVGLLAMGLKVMEGAGWLPVDAVKFGPALGLGDSNIVALVVFALLGFSLYHYARKPLQTPPPPKADLPGTPDRRVEA
ncbi:MAG TPA: oligopeptide transporter, OPT family [Vicinamibacteria bacterium]|nr:oligopeptide transporter, OPT family [Vicinamibacteria bacterium]